MNSLLQPFPWVSYSKKVARAILRPQCVGTFTATESEQRGMFLATGRAGSFDDAHGILLFWLVDPKDGTIVDARFQVFGQSALIAAAEIACQTLIGKNYDQASRISADFLEKQAQDHRSRPAFPHEAATHLNLVLEAIDHAADQCQHLPLPQSYTAPPLSHDLSNLEPGEYPGWEALSNPQKIAVIEQVIDQEIRPYIELDAGGVEVKEIINNSEVIITYKGNCTSCFSATGATLSAIQQILQTKIHPTLSVTPDLSTLQL